MTRIIIGLVLILTVFACQTSSSDTEIVGNPPAEGFNLEASDEKAMAIADRVMEAMGGRKAWDTTRYIKWTFFGRRTHTWDKAEDKVRIEIPSDTTTMIIDLVNKTGKIKWQGEEINEPDLVKLTKLCEHVK